MSNHPKQILYTAVYKWFQYSKSCDGMWDTKWITGGFPHCLGDFFIFHLDYMAECDALVTVVLLHDWGRFISVGAVQFVLPILDEKPLLYLSAPDSHRTWIRLLCLWQEGGGSHPHICALLAFHTAHSRGGIRPHWQILCAVQGWPRQNMFSQQLFRSEMLRN